MHRQRKREKKIDKVDDDGARKKRNRRRNDVNNRRVIIIFLMEMLSYWQTVDAMLCVRVCASRTHTHTATNSCLSGLHRFV